MSNPSTEQALQGWRHGQTLAERLVAHVIDLEGGTEIDPQQPLGGPDGKKDIIFQRNSERWIAAVFFPTTSVSFSKVKSKFKEDAKGIETNKASGFAFFTNRHLSVGERAELVKMIAPVSADIYHCERLRMILDSPRGCGLRLQYLQICMTEEEQWAYWQFMNDDLAQGLALHRSQLARIEEKLDAVLYRTNNLLFNATEAATTLDKPLKSLVFATSSLDAKLLCWLQRVATEDSLMPAENRGKLRSVDVWLAKAGSGYGSANWHPPSPEKLAPALEELFNWWTTGYPSLLTKTRKEIVTALAELHHRLLLIHPFLDGNGRVARMLIDQASNELLGVSVSKELTRDRRLYFAALQAADKGDLEPLTELITATFS